MTDRPHPVPFAFGEKHEPQQQAENHGRAERPLKQRLLGSPRKRLQLGGGEPVNVGINRFKLSTVLCAEKMTARRRRHGS